MKIRVASFLFENIYYLYLSHKNSNMKKLLSFIMLFVFLFAGVSYSHDLVVNHLGHLQLVERKKMPKAENIAVLPSFVMIEESCNGAPANS